jgi:hypothetical protein
MSLVMTLVYPVASSADQALSAPLGRAAREREAKGVAARSGAPAEVRFAVEEAGPAFQTREAALEAYRGRLDEPSCTLREVMAPVKGRPPRLEPVKPTFKDGRRWPEAKGEVKTVWRLCISYWKLVTDENPDPGGQARQARRDPSAEALDPRTLRALANQPLKPFKPQQPLDIGLFEVRAPEDQNLVLPDE